MYRDHGLEVLKCDADLDVLSFSADGSPLDVVASVINDKWVGLDVTISQQVTRGAKLDSELPPQAGKVLYATRRLIIHGLRIQSSYGGWCKGVG